MMCSGLGFGAALAPLVDDADLSAELVGVDLGSLDVADIGRDEHTIGQLQALEPLDEHRIGVQVIHRDIKKALHLCRVQIDRHHAIGAGTLEQIRHELGGDRRAAFVLAVLPGVAEVRDDRRHALGAGALQAVDPDHQLHQMRIDRMTRRLHDETIAAAHVFLDLDDQFAVGEQFGAPAAQRNLQVVADLLRELRIGAAGEELELVGVDVDIALYHGSPQLADRIVRTVSRLGEIFPASTRALRHDALPRHDANGPITQSGPMLRVAADERERMNHRIRADLHARLDIRIDRR